MKQVELSHILLVEDNENDVELTIDVLKNRKIANTIDVAVDGADAIAYIFKRGKWNDRQSGNPAIILLDLKLPKITGTEVLKQIRAHTTTKYIPVVILTSSCEERDILEGYRLGTNAYVVKPVAFDEFVKAVEQLGTFWGLINERPLDGLFLK